MKTSIASALLSSALVLSSVTVQAAPIEAGDGQQSAAVSGKTFDVFTYRPASCTPHLLLMVFHGVGRDAGPYRDHAKPIADKLCAVIVAPLFDKARFPKDLYQYGGVADHGQLLTVNRTVDLVAPLVAWARDAAGQKDMPYMLIGHSAGSQFLARVAAYTKPDAVRIVLANPSTWVMPTADAAVPFGFRGWEPDPLSALKDYLALPILVDLGGADTGSAELDMSPDAMAQGEYRLARGRNAFALAKKTAESHGWTLNWKTVEVPNVGHSATKMFQAEETISALQANAR
jgi:dienelactone hydrolase